MRFAFMVYVARSGSTLLAHQIAERCPSVLVMPEFQLPHLLLSNGDIAVRAMNRQRLERLLRTDSQLANVIGQESLRDVAESTCGFGIRAILEAVVDRYRLRAATDAETVVLKKGALLLYTDEIRRLFPEAAFIHPFRDPRGAVNSLIHTRDPYGARQFMARGDAVFATRYWRRFMRAAASVRRDETIPLTEVRYETLLERTDDVLENVARFLGASTAPSRSSPAPSVAGPEARMHALVESDPVAARSEAWARELKPWQGVAIERIAEDEMLLRGYGLWFRPKYGGGAQKMMMATAWAASLAHNVSHAARGVRHAASKLAMRSNVSI